MLHGVWQLGQGQFVIVAYFCQPGHLYCLPAWAIQVHWVNSALAKWEVNMLYQPMTAKAIMSSHNYKPILKKNYMGALILGVMLLAKLAF